MILVICATGVPLQVRNLRVEGFLEPHATGGKSSREASDPLLAAQVAGLGFWGICRLERCTEDVGTDEESGLVTSFPQESQGAR
jgi:hypothetical protein